MDGPISALLPAQLFAKPVIASTTAQRFQDGEKALAQCPPDHSCPSSLVTPLYAATWYLVALLHRCFAYHEIDRDDILKVDIAHAN